MTELHAFHSDKLQKIKFVTIMQKAFDENRLQSQKYWCESDQTGCLVGQITQDSDGRHDKFADDFNCPEWLPRLFDNIFEGLPEGQRQQFALDVIKAIPVGFSNWQSYYHKLCIFNLEQICVNTDHPTVKQAFADIISLHKLEETDKERWSAVRSAAESAAESAAWSAARSAAESAARSAAWSAAWSAARSAAESARSAAWSAAWSAVWSAVESAVWSAAESAAYAKISEKIISLFKEIRE